MVVSVSQVNVDDEYHSHACMNNNISTPHKQTLVSFVRYKVAYAAHPTGAHSFTAILVG